MQLIAHGVPKRYGWSPFERRSHYQHTCQFVHSTSGICTILWVLFAFVLRSSNASLSAHQANANLSFPKRARPRSPAYVDRFRSENLIIYILLVAHDGIFWVHANTRPRRPADAHLQREALIRLHKPAKRKVYLPQTVASATSGRIFCPFMPLVHSQQRPKRLSISSTGLIGRIHTDGSLRQASEVNSYRSEVAHHIGVQPRTRCVFCDF